MILMCRVKRKKGRQKKSVMADLGAKGLLGEVEQNMSKKKLGSYTPIKGYIAIQLHTRIILNDPIEPWDEQILLIFIQMQTKCGK